MSNNRMRVFNINNSTLEDMAVEMEKYRLAAKRIEYLSRAAKRRIREQFLEESGGDVEHVMSHGYITTKFGRSKSLDTGKARREVIRQGWEPRMFDTYKDFIRIMAINDDMELFKDRSQVVMEQLSDQFADFGKWYQDDCNKGSNDLNYFIRKVMADEMEKILKEMKAGIIEELEKQDFDTGEIGNQFNIGPIYVARVSPRDFNTAYFKEKMLDIGKDPDDFYATKTIPKVSLPLGKKSPEAQKRHELKSQFGDMATMVADYLEGIQSPRFEEACQEHMSFDFNKSRDELEKEEDQFATSIDQDYKGGEGKKKSRHREADFEI